MKSKRATDSNAKKVTTRKQLEDAPMQKSGKGSQNFEDWSDCNKFDNVDIWLSNPVWKLYVEACNYNTNKNNM